MTNIPITIKYLLTIIPSTFILEKIGYLYIFEWDFTEVYIDDPIHLTITLLWLAAVIWVTIDIIRRKKHVPNIMRNLFIITLLFYMFNITKYNYTFFEMIVFSFIPLLWLAAYVVSKNKACSEWFVN